MPSGACSPDAYRNEKYGFCLEVPQGYKLAENNSPGTEEGISLRWLGPSDDDAAYGEIDVEATVHADGSEPWQMLLIDREKSPEQKNTVSEEAAIAGGKFLVLEGKDAAKNDWTTVRSAVDGKRFSVGCTGGGVTKKSAPAIAAAKAICKSLRAL